MAYTSNNIVYTSVEETDFETVVDSTCKLLGEKHASYSLRKIAEYSSALKILEEELDGFISNKCG